jgi:hypothetical protein
MPFQFPISSPYLFLKDKGIGFGSFYLDVPLLHRGGIKR